MELIIKNGIVFDPANGIDGEKMDICVKDGKIVESVSDNAKVIDASNCVVMPGGVDPHSHIAGPKVNTGRIMRPEDSLMEIYKKKGQFKSGTGFSIPSTYKTGYQYSELGYTFCVEAAMPPLKAKHVHEEFVNTPQIEKTAMPLFGNNWFVFNYIIEKDFKALAAYVAWVLKVSRGYAIKIVNPGGTEAWGWGMNVHSLDDPVPGFDITPREIIRGLAKVNEMLGLPHSIHVHPNNLGHPGNWETTLETMDCVKEIKPAPRVGNRETVYHNTHVQFHSYGGTSWKDFEAKGVEIAEYVNKNKHVTIDVGQITLDETTTMTADGPMEFDLYMTTRLKWANCDVEVETGSGVVPFIYSPKGPVYSLQWAIGLEIFLYTKAMDRIMLTTDHPNAGPFTRYPRVIAWLMSKKYRDEWLYNKVHKWAHQRSRIGDSDREYTLYEIAQVTRTNAAKVFGLTEKGHLGVGADADIAIYEIDPEEKDGKKIEKAFRYVKYTIKRGEILVKDGELVNEKYYETWYVDVKVGEELYNEVLNDIRSKWPKLYSVSFENYPVSDKLANSWKVVKIDATDIN